MKEKIAMEVNEGLNELSLQLREWVISHLVPPRKITLARNDDGTDLADYWLVTDHIGEKDSSYRVIYDERKELFGLSCELSTGVDWYMGPYKSFSDAVESM